MGSSSGAYSVVGTARGMRHRRHSTYQFIQEGDALTVARFASRELDLSIVNADQLADLRAQLDAVEERVSDLESRVAMIGRRLELAVRRNDLVAEAAEMEASR